MLSAFDASAAFWPLAWLAAGVLLGFALAGVGFLCASGIGELLAWAAMPDWMREAAARLRRRT